MDFSVRRNLLTRCSVENSYHLVARGYLFSGLGDLLQEAGSPGGRPQKSISQLL